MKKKKPKKKSFKDETLSERDVESILFLDDLAPEDWAAIKRISNALFDEGKYFEDGLSYAQIQFKCAVAAFNEWLARLEVPFCVGNKPKKSIH